MARKRQSTLTLSHYTNSYGRVVWQGMYAGMPLFRETWDEGEARQLMRQVLRNWPPPSIANAPRTEWNGDTSTETVVEEF